MKNLEIILILVLVVLSGIFAVICVIDMVGAANNYEELVITGEVTHSEFFDDYFVLEFNNETSYEFKYQKGFSVNDYDFTVHSKLVIKMNRTDFDGILFKSDKLWLIESIIKVPDDDYD